VDFLGPAATACLLYHSEMEGMIAGRTASDMPGLDIAEQRVVAKTSVDSALRNVRGP